jgi:hypothetical protein
MFYKTVIGVKTVINLIEMAEKQKLLNWVENGFLQIKKEQLYLGICGRKTMYI